MWGSGPSEQVHLTMSGDVEAMVPRAGQHPEIDPYRLPAERAVQEVCDVGEHGQGVTRAPPSTAIVVPLT